MRSVGGQGGFVGGGDGIVFGLLILLAGSLAVVNIWASIDTRAALDAAAREYLRSYTEATSPTAAHSAGTRAAMDVLDRRGREPQAIEITPPDLSSFGPCQLATVVIEAVVPAGRLPFLDDLGARRIHVTHRELVDAHREMTNGPRHDPTATPCGSN